MPFFIYKWFTGVDPPADGSIGVIAPNPALFFAVLQDVGPNLTPETFREPRSPYPAPPTAWRSASRSCRTASKGTGLTPDYLGVDDATAIWWDPTVAGPDEIRKDGVGMYQYVDGGKRYLPGQWPTDDKMFDPAGAVALYTHPPPGEDPGDYPSPGGLRAFRYRAFSSHPGGPETLVRQPIGPETLGWVRATRAMRQSIGGRGRPRRGRRWCG